VARVEKVIQRKDGSEVKIVAQACFGRGLTCSIDVYVLRRDSPNNAWVLTSNRPHPDWRKMSVAEYITHGRSEMLRAASPAEILQATHALHTNLGL